MPCLKKDPNGYSPSDTISRLHNTIDSGVLGIDYTIIPREKNEALLESYNITENDRIEILKSLEECDYEGWEVTENKKHYKDIIHFFRKSVSLFPKGIEDAPAKKVNLYIKLTWQYSNNLMIVISFHETNQF